MVAQPLSRLPSTTELPCSDDTPVDNVGPWTSRSEEQNLLPNLLLLALASLWAERMDWDRDRHQPFEIYKIEAGEYRLQIGEPFSMPEVGLGVGRTVQIVGGIEREVLLWHDERGQGFPFLENVMKEMRSLGIDPDDLTD